MNGKTEREDFFDLLVMSCLVLVGVFLFVALSNIRDLYLSKPLEPLPNSVSIISAPIAVTTLEEESLTQSITVPDPAVREEPPVLPIEIKQDLVEPEILSIDENHSVEELAVVPQPEENFHRNNQSIKLDLSNFAYRPSQIKTNVREACNTGPCSSNTSERVNASITLDKNEASNETASEHVFSPEKSSVYGDVLTKVSDDCNVVRYGSNRAVHEDGLTPEYVICKGDSESKRFSKRLREHLKSKRPQTDN